jgi:acyl carrier protein
VSEVLARVAEIIVDVLDVPGLGVESVTRATTAEDVEEWDSLQHVRILTRVEREFGFRFTTDEVFALKNVGDLVDTIAARLG